MCTRCMVSVTTDCKNDGMGADDHQSAKKVAETLSTRWPTSVSIGPSSCSSGTVVSTHQLASGPQI